ncbi:DUF4193 domain-containing protein [Rhodococcus yananensis]|uniref:DUF4193 domain-containing protein n=1 Tax=Rhodococcus yananensis TaxID=2879464 RepID=UPI001CF92B85|nr:DUF4193 domain-containing protein [Rhodococcus yananensis]
MATDYDRPRVADDTEESLDILGGGRDKTHAAVADVEESDTAESFELPGADLSGEEFAVRVVPRQSDEFTCTRCFLVQHRNRLADPDTNVCADCA